MMCRNNEIEELKTKLNNQQSNQVAVIYVVGHSGMGKRTFLSSAYENKDIRDHFGACISVRFPPNISEEEMVKQIKEQLLQGGCSLYNRRDPNDAPGSSVSFLVWIDSQISMRKWRSVEHNLSTTIVTGERDKIKIMVSATSRHMWMEERNSIIIKLEHLDKKESSELFDYILKLWMPRTSDHIKMGIEEVKRNIKEITSGLPLAMVTLAKFMIAMDNYNKWETASNYTINKINDDKLKVILLLSVDDLPDELKVCLLYTAGFPDDTVIDAKQLVRLWTAEGFLSPQHGMEAEQLGQCYLKELIYRGLLLNKTSSKEDGDVHSVAIHSLVHHILRLEGQRRSFMHVHCGGGVVTAPDNTRRLALWNNHNTSIKLGDRYGKLRAVLSFGNNNMETQANDDQGKGCLASCRALIPLRCCVPPPCCPTSSCCAGRPWKIDHGIFCRLLKGSPYLRVINLEGTGIGPRLPDKIGDMVHLRYLGLRCPSLNEIPESIGKLGRLQTLDVRGTQVTYLPESFWRIRTLLHVLGDGINFPPELSISSKKKKEKIIDLDSLHTLENVNIQHVNDDWIPRFHFLHRLHVVELQESHKGHLETIFKALGSLQSLSLSASSTGAVPIDCFAIASEPNNAGSESHSCLEHLMSLELQGKLKPTTLSGDSFCLCLNNLTRLVLTSTWIGQNVIDIIAKLPVLTELVLLKGSYEGTEVHICANKEFRSLSELQLSGLFNLKTVKGPAAGRKMEMIVRVMDMGSVRYETQEDCEFCKSQPDAGETTAAGDNQANVTQTAEDTAKELLHEMILKAIENGNGHTTKTGIEKYIRSIYNVDPMVLLLEHMEQCKRLQSKIQRNYKIYFVAEPRQGGGEQPTASLLERIRVVIDRNGSTKTAISIKFKNQYGDDLLPFVLKSMESDKLLSSEKKGNYWTYLKPPPVNEDHGGGSGTTNNNDASVSARTEPAA